MCVWSNIFINRFLRIWWEADVRFLILFIMTELKLEMWTEFRCHLQSVQELITTVLTLTDGSDLAEFTQNTIIRMINDCSGKHMLLELLTIVYWNSLRLLKCMVTTYFLRFVEDSVLTTYSNMLGILGKLNIFPYILQHYIYQKNIIFQKWFTLEYLVQLSFQLFLVYIGLCSFVSFW